MITDKKQQSGKFIGTLLRWLALSLLFVGMHALAQSAGTVTYVYTDPQGTPLAEADASGNITATFEYTPYGTYAPQGTSTPGSVPKGPGYTGHVNDPETNLVYMQARYYDPATGHFLSVDPVSPESANIFNLNRYVYTDNNPIGHIDPNGREAACVSRPGHCDTSSQNQSTSNGERETAAAAGEALGDFNDQVVTPLIGANPVLGEEASASLEEISTFLKGLGSSGEATTLIKGAEAAGEVPAPTKVITLSKSLHGEAAQHAQDAIAAGKPDILTIARDGASANRKAAIGGLPKVAGKQLDEYPPAMFKEGGQGASVRAINPRDNLSSGACVGNACRGLPNGARVHIKVEN